MSRAYCAFWAAYNAGVVASLYLWPSHDRFFACCWVVIAGGWLLAALHQRRSEKPRDLHIHLRGDPDEARRIANLIGDHFDRRR